MRIAFDTAMTNRVPTSGCWQAQTSGNAFAAAVVYPFAVSGAVAVKHSQKRLAMAGTDIDGWPLGPREGTSG
jgi:hypothetical protein